MRWKPCQDQCDACDCFAPPALTNYPYPAMARVILDRRRDDEITPEEMMKMLKALGDAPTRFPTEGTIEQALKERHDDSR